MHLISVKHTAQIYALPKDIALLIGMKSSSRFLRDFRKFCDDNPKHFGIQRPYLAIDGNDTVYNIFCFLHWYEYRSALDAGARSIKFEDDLPRIKELMAMATIEEEVV